MNDQRLVRLSIPALPIIFENTKLGNLVYLVMDTEEAPQVVKGTGSHKSTIKMFNK